jgi:hypothetical protein
MSTPRGIVFNQNVLVVVHHDFAIVVGHDDLYGTILLLRKRLGLDAGLDLAVNKALNKSTNILLSELLVLVEGEFLIFDSLLDGKGGPLVDLEVEVASVSSEGFGVDGREIDNTLVLLG